MAEPERNPFDVGAAEEDLKVRFDHGERLRAIRSVRRALLVVGFALGCIMASEAVPPTLPEWRFGLRIAGAVTSFGAVVFLAVSWFRVQQRCSLEVARLTRLGTLIQLSVYLALLAFVIIRLAGEPLPF